MKSVFELKRKPSKWATVVSVYDHKKKLIKWKKRMIHLFRFLILAGIIYVILSPLIVIISNSFFSPEDVYSPVVSLIPLKGTLENYITSFKRMTYSSTILYTLLYVVSLTLLQVLICSLAGYGFARFKFPFKKFMFACVIFSIVLPTHTIMLPLYMRFRDFDFLGVVSVIKGSRVNLLGTVSPMYVMTLFGVGLRSGLYIYIFNQFFRGLPIEIEEAAFVDGAGAFYTYFKIMLRNAMPAVLTCSVFSMVWQYNDNFYASLFSINSKYLISMKMGTLRTSIEYLDKIMDSSISQTYVYAGVVMTLLPIVIIYIVLQKYFIEGVERSGIVG